MRGKKVALFTKNQSNSDFESHWGRIDSVLSGHSLDIEGASKNPGTRVIVYETHNNENQLWNLHKGFIRSKLDKSLVLDYAVINRFFCCVNF
jgi:hypothetical protein